MGILNKLGLHVADTYLSCQIQGMKLGGDITKGASTPVKAAGFVAGFIGGSVVGIAQLWNPAKIAENMLAPESELEKKLDEKERHLRT